MELLGLVVPGGGPWVLCMDNKGFTILTTSIDPFMQGCQTHPPTPKILVSGKLCFSNVWMELCGMTKSEWGSVGQGGRYIVEFCGSPFTQPWALQGQVGKRPNG